jgi:hypothetical protein
LILTKREAVGAALIARIVKLDRIVFPPAHGANLVGAWRRFAQRTKAATRAEEASSDAVPTAPGSPLPVPQPSRRPRTWQSVQLDANPFG